MDSDLIEHYNYESFTPPNFRPWMNFDQSPLLGERGPNFPIWTLGGEETSLELVLREHTYTVLEFGSFT